MQYMEERKKIIYWAKKLNEKGFVTARSGNISLKVEKGLLITSHDCYLGELRESDILLVDLEGKILEGDKELTSEKSLHLDIHKKFKDIKVVMHSHSPWTVAFFHHFKSLDIFSFEAKFYLGDIKVIPQDTPTVTDTAPLVSSLENNNIVVLGNHGVVAIGIDFKECFSLIELLEEQAKVNLILKVTKSSREVLRTNGTMQSHPVSPSGNGAGKVTRDEDKIREREERKEKFKLLSKEHIERLIELVNNDKETQELGRKYDLTCSLAVKNVDTGDCTCFYYEKGKIINTDNNENAEFIISGKTDILKKVFNRKISPFVASTQGKVKTKGDFTKMSRWYPVLVRTFKLWEQAPVG